MRSSIRTLLGDESLGIRLEYARWRDELMISGHYDGGRGQIPEHRLSLGLFLRLLGITLKDCREALGEPEKPR